MQRWFRPERRGIMQNAITNSSAFLYGTLPSQHFSEKFETKCALKKGIIVLPDTLIVFLVILLFAYLLWEIPYQQKQAVKILKSIEKSIKESFV